MSAGPPIKKLRQSILSFFARDTKKDADAEKGE